MGEVFSEETETLIFNPFSPEVRADPYPVYRKFREEDPVHLSPFGVWILTRYADAVAVLKNPAFSSDHRHAEGPLLDLAASQRDPELLERRATVMLFQDPPAHTRLRSLVNKAFTPRRVEAMRAGIIEIVDDLLDRAGDAGRMDVIADLAYPLPVTVICEMLGVPPEDYDTFKGWSSALAANLDPLPLPESLAKALAAGDAFEAYFRELIADRRANPRDDLLSDLVAAEEKGDRLSEEELLAMCTLILVAGHETTVNLIGNGTLALLRHPGEIQRLLDDISLMPGAVEELLRYDSPVQVTARTALTDVDVAGTTIPKGRQVVAVIGAANRDPSAFADPDRLDIGRTENHHLAFGAGIHFCLGASLARTEGQIAIGRLVTRFPGLSLEVEDPPWRETVTLRGLAALPVTF